MTHEHAFGAVSKPRLPPECTPVPPRPSQPWNVTAHSRSSAISSHDETGATRRTVHRRQASVPSRAIAAACESNTKQRETKEPEAIVSSSTAMRILTTNRSLWKSIQSRVTSSQRATTNATRKKSSNGGTPVACELEETERWPLDLQSSAILCKATSSVQTNR